MNDSQDPLRNLKRGPDPRATSSEREHAELRLRRAMENERRGRRQRARIWIPAVAGLGLIVLIWTMLRPTAAQAILMDTAEAARLATPLDIPTGGFVYTRSQTVDLQTRPGSDFGLGVETVSYLLRGVREVWRNPAEQFVQIRTVVSEASFFDPAVSGAYFRLELDTQDGLGETRTEQFAGVRDDLADRPWPTDPNDLLAAMEAYLANSNDARPHQARLLDLAADLLRETIPSPDFRGALIEVLSRFDYEVDQTETAIVLAVDYQDRLATRIAVTISSAGHLLREEITLLEADSELGLPANTTISLATYSLPAATLDLG